MPAPSADHPPAGPILPLSTRNLVDKVSFYKRHPGLQLDKLSFAGEQKKQRDVLEALTFTRGDRSLLPTLIDRRNIMLTSLGAERLPMTTRGPLTLHLSRSGALENAGIALHPIYGFVYLPGSGVKGLVRAWAETVWAASQPDKEKAWRRIDKTFGWSPGSERHKQGWRPNTVASPEGAAAGRLVFHDAWPTRWPRLGLDVINNHHVKYYAGEDDPGDWENPTLVYFLAIGGSEKFEFALSDRKRAGDDLLETACGWLEDALTTEGAGAKTAAGYGRFKPSESKAPVIIAPDLVKAGFASARFDLKLATPAFLAGADQKNEDCDLRTATLRGLLRWWWRTMHTAHVDRGPLKRLETAVWGDSQSGSPVRIAVDFIKGRGPQQHPDKRDQQFQQEHSLQRPDPSKKVTQGLFYASYGMAEGGRNDHWRWFRPAGSCWRVTLTSRSGLFDAGSDKGVSLSAAQLLKQATAALWLLTQFGGSGSRSRKGFGSFDDIPIQDIGSKEDCIKAAACFREDCKLNARRSLPVQAPALEEALILEQPTAWRDPWYALDQTGMVLQLFTKNLAAEERIALGLPRRVGRGQRSLRAGGIERHAAPALWSLATRQDGTLLVRLIAFPAARLPDKAMSEEILQRLIDFAHQELKQQAEQAPHRTGGLGGPRHSQPPDTGRAATSPRQANLSRQPLSVPGTGLPKANDRVEAELLEEKTKKGGWKAKHLDSRLEGAIQDTKNVPADAKSGQLVELTVAYANEKKIAFKWAAPPAPKEKRDRSSRQGYQRRWR